jgi:hypothetical protein
MNRITVSLFVSALFLIIFKTGYGDGKKGVKLNAADSLMNLKINEFVIVKLKTDITKLTYNEKKMIPLLIDAAKIMDDLYWKQVIGDKKKFMDSISNPFIKRFADINYGPWERLNGNQSFVKGYGVKPAGANFYPKNLTKTEFEKWQNKDKSSQYTLIRRKSDKTLSAVWYHIAYKAELTKAASLLNQAALFADDPGLRKYLQLRAKALLSDDYYESDMAWMDMKNNTIDFVVGPIENYEDGLFGYKTAYESALLVKDKEWSQKLAKFAKFLPELQKELPVADQYKTEIPGSDSDLNAYDIIYVSGHSNAGSKTIAINLPNDEKVQMAKGSRRLQLKNAMQAKFEKILVPIATVLIDSTQVKNIKFDAFFSNVMFHEVAHGLGIKNTINNKGTVREALKEKYSSFEEAKADILGLFMTTKLIDRQEIKDITKEDCFVTYMAGLIRSVRFGAASAHGKANMMCFNYFADNGAFIKTSGGTYKVNFDKMATAMNDWASQVLVFEGNGDYQGASAYLEANGKIRESLQKDLARLKTAHIPVDIIYNQGIGFMGLK